MKKSVILILSILYIFAVILVGTIGIHIRVDEVKNYVDHINCLNDEVVVNNNDGIEADLIYQKKFVSPSGTDLKDSNCVMTIRCKAVGQDITKDPTNGDITFSGFAETVGTLEKNVTYSYIRDDLLYFTYVILDSSSCKVSFYRRQQPIYLICSPSDGGPGKSLTIYLQQTR